MNPTLPRQTADDQNQVCAALAVMRVISIRWAAEEKIKEEYRSFLRPASVMAGLIIIYPFLAWGCFFIGLKAIGMSLALLIQGILPAGYMINRSEGLSELLVNRNWVPIVNVVQLVIYVLAFSFLARKIRKLRFLILLAVILIVIATVLIHLCLGIFGFHAEYDSV